MRRITAVAGLTGPLLVRRFLADYTRNAVNLLMLVLLPAAFVAAAAGSMSQLARHDEGRISNHEHIVGHSVRPSGDQRIGTPGTRGAGPGPSRRGAHDGG